MAAVTWTPTVAFRERVYQVPQRLLKTVGGKPCLEFVGENSALTSLFTGIPRADLRGAKASFAPTDAYKELVEMRNRSFGDTFMGGPENTEGLARVFGPAAAKTAAAKRRASKLHPHRKRKAPPPEQSLMTVKFEDGRSFECVAPLMPRERLQVVVDDDSLTTVLNHLADNITSLDQLQAKQYELSGRYSKRHAQAHSDGAGSVGADSEAVHVA